MIVVLVRSGHKDIADLLRHFTAKGFAHWRWHLLADCSREVYKLMPLVQHWPKIKMSVFAKVLKDESEKSQEKRQLLKLVDAGLQDAASNPFQRQLYFIQMFSKNIDKKRTWGGGCACHEKELRQGKAVTCSMKVRDS